MNAKNREKGEEDSTVVEKNVRNDALKAGTSGTSTGTKPKPSGSHNQDVDEDIGRSNIKLHKSKLQYLLEILHENTLK